MSPLHVAVIEWPWRRRRSHHRPHRGVGVHRFGQRVQPATGPVRGDIGPRAVTEENNASATQDGPASGRRRRRRSFWRELPFLALIALVLAVLIRTFLLQAFFIPSGSMEPTLHGCRGCSGDRVLVNKLVYRVRDPHRGEIVVFRGPPSWQDTVEAKHDKDLIKRVVGVA